MFIKSLLFTFIVAAFLFTAVVCAQKPATVATVEVAASAKIAEVGQQVKLTVVARDAAGKVLNEQPSTYFAGPPDIAAVDEEGNVKLFGAGEVTAGALVGGKPGFVTLVVKPAIIKTVEINSIPTPLAVGSTVQLMATTRIFSGDPRSGVQ